MKRKHLVYIGAGILIIWLLCSDANATPGSDTGPNSASQPDAHVELGEPRRVPVTPNAGFGRTSDSNFGTGSSTRPSGLGGFNGQVGEQAL